MTYIDGINKDNMDQFLGALESGKYKKGVHRLHTASDDSMCCLGVATAEIGPKCGVVLLDVTDTDGGSYPMRRVYQQESNGNFYSLLMPPDVTKALGIPETFIDSTGSGDVILVIREDADDSDFDDYYRDETYLVAVSTLNDAGRSHAEIARRIRETLSVKEA